MSIIKKSISLSLIAAIALTGLTGCNGVNPVPSKTPQEISNIENRIKFVNEQQKVYEEVNVGKHIIKKDNLNHKGLPDINVSVDFSDRDVLLKDVSDIIGFPILVEKSIEMNKVNFNGKLKGNMESILDFIAGVSDVYWTYENNVVRFVKQKDVIYTFPIFSVAKMSTIYNVGNEDDKFDIENIKEDVFDEVKNMLTNVLGKVSFTGDIRESFTYQKELSSESRKNGTNRDILNSSTKENDTNIVSLKDDKRDETTKSTQVEKQDGNSKVYEYNLSKVKEQKGRGKGAQPVKPNNTLLGLEPGINNTTNLNDSNKNILSDSDRNINSTINSNSKDISNEKSLSKDKNNVVESIKNDVNKDTVNKQSEVTYTTKIDESVTRVSISKESGMIHVSVSPSEEKKIDSVLSVVMKNMLSSLITMDLFILEVEEEKLAEFNQNFDGVLTSGVLSKSFSLGTSGASFAYDNLTAAQDLVSGDLLGLSSGKNLNFMLSYLTGDSRGEILSQPKLISLPNMPARMKDSIFIPYLKPGEITSDTTNITYQVENVESGIDFGMSASVLGNDIVVSIGLSINEYLGDKTISAGTLGEYNLPMQAPKILNNTFRVKPGDLIILGGSNKINNSKDNFDNLFIPTSFNDNLSKKKFLVVAMPKLVKFVEEEDLK